MASEADTDAGSRTGANVMVAGIIIQMAAITIYVVVQAEYLWRLYNGRPVRSVAQTSEMAMAGINTPDDKQDSSSATVTKVVDARARVTKNIFLMLIGLLIATVFIYIRSIYRTIEVRSFVLGVLFPDADPQCSSCWTDGTVRLSPTRSSSVRSCGRLDGTFDADCQLGLPDTLDGMPIFLAMFTLNVFHVGRLVPLAAVPNNAV